jgi:hypothetical protein
MRRAGIVKEFTLQPKFTLQPPYVKDGKVIQAIQYIADFDVTYAAGDRQIIDVKGHSTKDFLIKRKMYDYLAAAQGWPKLTLMTRDSKVGWVDLDRLTQANREAAKYAKQAEKASRRRQAKQSSEGESKGRKSANI